MLDWSDRHFRYLLRLMSKNILLYTEMLTVGALIHGDRERFLNYSEEERPVALQLGGSDPDDLATCAKWVEQAGYNEVNLNVGCPSNRVQAGAFGVCLMLRPQLVADCIAAMQQAVSIPVTVKTRIGVDHNDSYEELVNFVGTVAETGCETFIIHARKAWLQGLSPKENRNVPPLRYEVVKQLKQDFPQLEIIVNGGVQTAEQIKEHLAYADGVMIGREAYKHPFFVADFDELFFGGEQSSLPRSQIVEQYLPYIESQLRKDVPLKSITRHMLGLFQGQPGARAWRRYLSENAFKPGVGLEVVEKALMLVK